MKRSISICAGVLLLGACARQPHDDAAGGSPNLDTGMAQQNTAVNAAPDTVTTRSPEPAKRAPQLTNTSAKPQHPPAR